MKDRSGGVTILLFFCFGMLVLLGFCLLVGCGSDSTANYYTHEFSTEGIDVRGYWATHSIELLSGSRESCNKYFGQIDFSPGRGSLRYEPDIGTAYIVIQGPTESHSFVKRRFETRDLSIENIRKLLREAKQYRHSDQYKLDARECADSQV